MYNLKCKGLGNLPANDSVRLTGKSLVGLFTPDLLEATQGFEIKPQETWCTFRPFMKNFSPSFSLGGLVISGHKPESKCVEFINVQPRKNTLLLWGSNGCKLSYVSLATKGKHPVTYPGGH